MTDEADVPRVTVARGVYVDVGIIYFLISLGDLALDSVEAKA